MTGLERYTIRREIPNSLRFRHEFCVISQDAAFEFPLDMLRYDGCYPLNEQSSQHMQRTFAHLAGVERVWLVHEDRAPDWLPNFERWESFSWAVVPVAP